MPARGTLFLVAGPSGAGKDTLLGEAQKRLPATYVFPRRIVTRLSVDGSEDHVPESAQVFAARLARGEFAFAWSAHGLSYAIPASIWRDLDEGRHVVVNVSRAIAAKVRDTCTPSHVILVTARREVLAERLASRRRETENDIAMRLDRAVDLVPDTLIVNEGSIDAAVSRFLAALQG
jgi:phosphonate metabolism protein PhnN/1,5-bisphosphokinase (PRPP-forming)